jgi:hypothetical protein
MVELTVDNFLAEKFLNDFNAQEAKSLEIALFDHFHFLSSWHRQLTSSGCKG